MTLGNIIEFPNLERLHLYRFGDCMQDRPDDLFQDHKEYMVIWQRYMPHLVEVALAPDVIWSRAPGCKTPWARMTVKPMRGVEGLVTL